MITDITIGQYFPGDSVVHKMDSRMKIILTVLLIVQNPACSRCYCSCNNCACAYFQNTS